jgi:hypothetical protein
MLLILDYPGRRPEAHLRDLRLEEYGYDCRYLLDGLLPAAVDSWEYARQLYHREPDPPEGAVAVLSYCSAAPLAVSTARLGSAVDDLPLPMVFLDPGRCELHHLVDNYAAVVRQIEGAGTGTGSGPLLDIASLVSHPWALVERVEQDLLHRARLALAADGFDEAEASAPLDHMVGIYLQWLRYLVAVHHRRPGPGREVLQVLSRHHAAGLDWLGVPDGELARVDCARPELPRHPGTRAVVLEFLARVAAAPAPMEVADGR